MAITATVTVEAEGTTEEHTTVMVEDTTIEGVATVTVTVEDLDTIAQYIVLYTALYTFTEDHIETTTPIEVVVVITTVTIPEAIATMAMAIADITVDTNPISLSLKNPSQLN